MNIGITAVTSRFWCHTGVVGHYFAGTCHLRLQSKYPPTQAAELLEIIIPMYQTTQLCISENHNHNIHYLKILQKKFYFTFSGHQFNQQ